MTQMTGQTDAVQAIDSAAVAASSKSDAQVSLAYDLSQLTKPRIALMVALTVLLGWAMTPAAMAFSATLLAALIGTALASMGAACLNQVIERDADARMQRTATRPISAGRLSATAGSLLGLTSASIGVGLMAWFTTPVATGLTLLTLASYVLLYTPLKRVTSLSTIVGAVPGALPPVIGYAAATGHVGLAAWAMFAIMFVWQLPHFLAIAWLYRDDYAAAGMPMLPVVDPTGASTYRQMLVSCVTLIPLSLLPTAAGITGQVYFTVASVAGVAFAVSAVMLVIRPSRAAARRVFFVSLVYLPAVLMTMALDQLP